ncbi:hypothetical protein BDQ17DRAFT_1334338 [Cyathus striatus]|nr:hypothetical protein BDQ17DRAFT_1334338 [Cyathus striatus]
MTMWFIDLMEATGQIYRIHVAVKARFICLLLDIMNGSMFEGNTLVLFYEIFCDMPMSQDAATTILRRWKHVEKIEPIIDSNDSAFDDWVIECMAGGIWPTCYDIKASMGRLIHNYCENHKSDVQPNEDKLSVGMEITEYLELLTKMRDKAVNMEYVHSEPSFRK